NSGFSWTAARLPNLSGGVGRASVAAAGGVAYAIVGAADGIEYAGFYKSADATGATVVFGGVGIYRSINAGSNWTMLASGGGTHSDQHAIAFDPASAHSFFLGNDGGLYRFDVGTLTWAALNASISAAQTQSA